MKRTRNYNKDYSNYKKYKVYGCDAFGFEQYVGETFAKSPAQAVNNVRFRTFGLNLTNDSFYAKEI